MTRQTTETHNCQGQPHLSCDDPNYPNMVVWKGLICMRCLFEWLEMQGCPVTIERTPIAPHPPRENP